MPPRLQPMTGLYLHIPFCQAICSYCNFNRGLFDPAVKPRYVSALDREVREAGDGRPVDTIFFGGGTPSLLDPADIARVISTCRRAYEVSPSAEITLETNPETATRDRLAGFLDAGVNRFSFGAQSFDDAQLQRLGRIHDAGRIAASVEAARLAGCTNLSLDLMFWLPGQSRESWLASVAQAAALEPEHLSLYLLELYPNAPLKDAMARAMSPESVARMTGPEAAAWAQASDDDAAEMYLMGLERLDAAGYHQYEISNVARPGFESRHNLKYWTSGTWRGFGCGAHSTVGGRRWQNVAGTVDYIDRIEAGQRVDIGMRTIVPAAAVEEALFTGLRLSCGVDGSEFAEIHGVEPWQRYGEQLKDAVDAGLVWRQGSRFGLSRAGMLMANEVLAVFV
jgi:oxygen-independent coproporphyrinogen-3 oxidase